MGKKYVPSGYQILDLGTLNDGDIIVNGQSEDRNVLLELFKTKRIIGKPLLLKLFGTMIVIPSFVNLFTIYASYNNTTDGISYIIRMVYQPRDEGKITVTIHDDL